jgi:ABC-type bacteriocin/lantibiotic exporter with double-glycine peptidase domain
VDLPFGFFQQRTAGDLMMRLNSNSMVREILTSTAMSASLDGALVSLYLIVLFIMSPTMGALVLALGLLRVAVFVLSRGRLRELMNQTLQTQALLQNYQVQVLAGIETLKSSGAEHRAVDRWSKLFSEALAVTVARGRLSIVVDGFMGVLGSLSPLLFLGIGGLQVMSGHLTLGSMLALNGLAAGFLGPLSSLVSTGIRLQEMGSYLDRLEDVLETPVEQEASKVVPAGSLSGRITLSAVSFRFSPSSPLVVRDVTCEIQPGQFVAIVGASGAGKSTLGRLLLGLYQPIDGRILYDGIDLRQLEARSVRRQLGIVLQHPYLFGGTVRENIALADPGLPMERIMEVAMIADVHHDVLCLPFGYDTSLADGGASLSAGQRQRIAIARALAHRPSILLLDEATSALDSVTEQHVHRKLASLQCTRIVIAHRLSTVIHADVILVMNDGRVVEHGSHQRLMALRGRYAELVAAQIESEVASAAGHLRYGAWTSLRSPGASVPAADLGAGDDGGALGAQDVR